MSQYHSITGTEIVNLLTEARARTLELVADLDDEQMKGPSLSIVNPPIWEIGHVAWFQEKWALRHLRNLDSIRADSDALYDSAAVAHDTRWNLSFPSREETLAYMQATLDRLISLASSDRFGEEEIYFHLLPLFHEDMHAEAITYTRQTLSYPPPRFNHQSGSAQIQPGGESQTGDVATESEQSPRGGPLAGDVEVPGGVFMLGATPDIPFVFDNEKWAHAVEVRPFKIARAPVTNIEFAAFVDDSGYFNERWWSRAGWLWRNQNEAAHPVYWQREARGRWLRRVFDKLVSLEDHLPVIHVNWYEAEAYCNWAGRRLATEAEWEMAASAAPAKNSSSEIPGNHSIAFNKRRFPWGDAPPSPARANLDWNLMGLIEVGALPASDSAFGCRQMVGNVWEWTADEFLPYPGFAVDPYKEYSAPWFGDHKVLRGGCWTTRSRLIRNTWRNFYTPDRRDVWAGFRTCALDPRPL